MAEQILHSVLIVDDADHARVVEGIVREAFGRGVVITQLLNVQVTEVESFLQHVRPNLVIARRSMVSTTGNLARRKIPTILTLVGWEFLEDHYTTSIPCASGWVPALMPFEAESAHGLTACLGKMMPYVDWIAPPAPPSQTALTSAFNGPREKRTGSFVRNPGL